MSDRVDLERAWAVLDRPQLAQYSTYPITNLDTGMARAGIDREGRRLLLVPAENSVTLPTVPFPMLTMRVERAQFSGDAGSYLVIQCEDPFLWKEFSALGEDVLDAAADATRPASCALEVVGRWRRLLAVTRGNRLSPGQRIALFAELVVLRAALLAEAPLGAQVWAGPSRARHDFDLGGHHVEVKSIGTSSTAVTIHGIDQLESPEAGFLTLAVALVLENPEGTPIRAVVEDIVSLLDDPTEFTALLARTGWTREDAEIPYAIAEWLFVDVDERTPRLVSADLPGGQLREGVGKVSYDVDLDTLRPLARHTTLTDLVAAVIG